jgi:hypothetical protein
MFLLPVEGELVQTERARQRELLQPGPEVEEALGVQPEETDQQYLLAKAWVVFTVEAEGGVSL